MNVPITKIYISDEEANLAMEAIKSGWVVQGPNVATFESAFAGYTGIAHGRATTNCTSALHLGMLALGLGKGDKVVVPSFTFVASANAVLHTGAEILFCDINLETFNIDPEKLDELIGNDASIKAVMPVHLFGLPADMDQILPLCKHSHLKIIEDAACGLGAKIGEAHVGSFGDCGAFSFHPRKVITTGEGGMFVSNSGNLAEKVTIYRDHGANFSDYKRHVSKGGSLLPEFEVCGYNYRMTDIQGALGVEQMKKLGFILENRARLAQRYTMELQQFPMLKTPLTPENMTHGFQSYVCLYTEEKEIKNLSIAEIDRLNEKRNRLMYDLEEDGVATRQGTHAVHTLGYYQKTYGFKPDHYKMAYAADRLSITLPLYATMTDDEFEYVISMLKKHLNPKDIKLKLNTL